MGQGGAEQVPVSVYLLATFGAIGGFLFGYDTGVVSGAMILIRDEFKLNNVWHEAIISATIGAAWLSALIAGRATDVYGRRIVILSASVIFCIGAVMMGAAPEKITLLVGRVIVGIGIGLASMSVPVYLSESAPSEFRGRITVINNVFITGGQFVASVLCGALSYVPHGWRYMLGLAGIPSVIQLAGFVFLPESPRWLVSKGRVSEARDILVKIRSPEADIDGELQAISGAVAEAEEQKAGIGQVLRSGPVRRALVVGSLLQFFQQISGINTVMYYSASIITMAGVTDQSTAIWLAAATSSVNFFGTFIGLYLVEKVGRRPLTLGSLIGTTASLLLLGLSFQMAFDNSPEASLPVNGTCNYLSCGVCTSKADCGFCFMGDIDNVQNSSCVQTNVASFNEKSQDGFCSNSTLLEDHVVTYAYDWCPYEYAWLSILGLALYLLFFSPGMGPMPWTINSEIYPGWARSTCTSLTTSVNWASNLIVSFTFLTLTEVILKHGTFYLYTGLAGVGTILFYFILPETRGVPLEEIESLFSMSLWTMSRHTKKR
ncbi:proton myo-inositol cotransporter-like isoform X2 [Palaemon carinicauda]